MERSFYVSLYWKCLPGDVDAFLKGPSWNYLPDPLSIPSMEKGTARYLAGFGIVKQVLYGWTLTSTSAFGFSSSINLPPCNRPGWGASRAVSRFSWLTWVSVGSRGLPIAA